MDLIKDSEKIGNIIRILDKYTFIIDAGEDIVSVGDTIQIYDSNDIIYGLDKKPLAYHTYIKDEATVIKTEKLYSICEKEKYLMPSVPTKLALSPLLQASNGNLRESLNVNEEDIQPFSPIDKTIHIGDPVKKC